MLFFPVMFNRRLNLEDKTLNIEHNFLYKVKPCPKKQHLHTCCNMMQQLTSIMGMTVLIKHHLTRETGKFRSNFNVWINKTIKNNN